MSIKWGEKSHFSWRARARRPDTTFTRLRDVRNGVSKYLAEPNGMANIHKSFTFSLYPIRSDTILIPMNFFFCRESTANNAIRLPNWNIETMALNYSLFTYCNTFFSLSAVDIWPRSSSKIKWYFSAHLIRNGRFGVRSFFEVQGKEKQICVRELQIL